MTEKKKAAGDVKADEAAPKGYVQKSKYRDGKENLLELKATQIGETEVRVEVIFTKKGEKREKIGLETFATRAEADARFTVLLEEVVANGWSKTAESFRQKFAVIPKAEKP